MHVAERMQDETLVLMISGRFTFYSRKVFQAIVNNAKLSGARNILFNVREVTFMDSLAIGGLALAYLSLKEAEVDMYLVGPQKTVKTQLEEANFPSLIPTFPTEEKAFRAIH